MTSTARVSRSSRGRRKTWAILLVAKPHSLVALSGFIERLRELPALDKFRQGGKAFTREVILLNDGSPRRRSQMIESAGMREYFDDTIAQFIELEKWHEDTILLVDDVA